MCPGGITLKSHFGNRCTVASLGLGTFSTGERDSQERTSPEGKYCVHIVLRSKNFRAFNQSTVSPSGSSDFVFAALRRVRVSHSEAANQPLGPFSRKMEFRRESEIPFVIAMVTKEGLEPQWVPHYPLKMSSPPSPRLHPI